MVSEGYKETEIGVIPEEWEVKSLSEIGSFSKGKGISKNEVVESGIPCMRYAEIYTKYDTVLKNIKSFINEESALNSKKIENGDILFAGSGETLDDIGKSVAFIDDFEAYVGGDTVILSPTINYNPLFMSFQLNSTSIRTQLRKLGQGSSVVHIYSSGLEKVVIPFPPLKEQEKIADILSTADEKIDAIALQIQKAQTLKKGLLQKLLSEGIGHSEFKDSELGKIPESWEVIPFLELADKKVNYSFTGGPFGSDLKSEHYTKDGVRVIQLQNIGDGSFINKDFVYTSEEKAEALKTCQIFPNDILLAKMAEPVARACIMPNIEEKYLMGSDGIRLYIDKSKYDTHFIFHSINFSRFRDIAIARSTGTTRLRIGLTALKKIPIVIPPLEEQKQIADILSTADEKLEVLRAKKEKYETLKKGLLQKLLSGEVRV